MRGSLPQLSRHLLLQHDCFAEGGDCIPFPLAPDHGFHQRRTREFAAADSLHEDTAVFRPSGAHRHGVLHRVLRAILAVARAFPPARWCAGTSRNIRVRWGPASGGRWGRRSASLATPQRGDLPPRLRRALNFMLRHKNHEHYYFSIFLGLSMKNLRQISYNIYW